MHTANAPAAAFSYHEYKLDQIQSGVSIMKAGFAMGIHTSSLMPYPREIADKMKQDPGIQRSPSTLSRSFPAPFKVVLKVIPAPNLPVRARQAPLT